MAFRRELSNEINIYYLLLRALLLFHQHPGFKIDCTVTLFLLVFNDYTIGSNDISIPKICTNLRIPLKCNIRLKQSQYNKISQLEELLLQHNNGHLTESSSRSDSFSSEISTNIPANSINKNIVWQNIRIYFAHNWFDDFYNFFKNNKTSKKIIPNYDFHKNSLKFDQQLKLTADDIITIQSTLPDCSINHWLQIISNATNHGDVLLGLSQIENFILLSEKNVIQFNDFKNATMRFISTVPNTHGDEIIYKLMLNVLEKLIDHGE